MISKGAFIWCVIVYAAECVQAQSNTCSVSSGSSTLTSALLKSLYAGADQGVRPASDCGGPTIVGGSLKIVNFLKDRANPGIYRINDIVNLNWNDSRLAWDPSQFGGIQTILVSPDKIWHPDGVHSNVVLYSKGVYSDVVYHALVTSDGHVSWTQPSSAQSVGVSTKDSAGYEHVSVKRSFVVDVITAVQDNDRLLLAVTSLTHSVFAVSFSSDKTAIIFQTDPTITVANFYDLNGEEEYVFVSGTLSMTEQIYPSSTQPFSVIIVDMNFRSKAKTTNSPASY